MGLSISTIDPRGEATVNCVSIASIMHAIALFMQLSCLEMEPASPGLKRCMPFFCRLLGSWEKVRGPSSSLGLRLSLPKFDRLDMAL